MAETVTGSGVKGKIARKYMAHFLDASFGGTTPEWYRLGEDLEEYSVDLNPDTEVKKNILGNTSFNHNGYEPSADSDPYYARVGDPLFEHLQTIVDTLATDDGCKTSRISRTATSCPPATAATPLAIRSPSRSTTSGIRPRGRITPPRKPLPRRLKARAKGSHRARSNRRSGPSGSL